MPEIKIRKITFYESIGHFLTSFSRTEDWFRIAFFRLIGISDETARIVFHWQTTGQFLNWLKPLIPISDIPEPFQADLERIRKQFDLLNIFRNDLVHGIHMFSHPAIKDAPAMYRFLDIRKQSWEEAYKTSPEYDIDTIKGAFHDSGEMEGFFEMVAIRGYLTKTKGRYLKRQVLRNLTWSYMPPLQPTQKKPPALPRTSLRRGK